MWIRLVELMRFTHRIDLAPQIIACEYRHCGTFWSAPDTSTVLYWRGASISQPQAGKTQSIVDEHVVCCTSTERKETHVHLYTRPYCDRLLVCHESATLPFNPGIYLGRDRVLDHGPCVRLTSAAALTGTVATPTSTCNSVSCCQLHYTMPFHLSPAAVQQHR